jgi:uncharacterized protein
MLALLALCCAGAVAWAALTFPALSGRVVDEAAILDLQTTAIIEQKLATLEEKTTNQLVVVTLKSLQGTSIEDYGYQLGRSWGIGQKRDNNGVLLIVAPQDRKVRIEVGYGLEGILTDAVTRLIIENAILPRFRTGDFAGGISRGVDDIVSALSGNADDFKQRASQRPETASPAFDVGGVIVFVIIMILIVRAMSGGSGGTGGRGLRGRRGGIWGSAPVIFPGGGSWGSGSSGGGSSGGGFSGGGGSFGGGGSSGSW